MKVIIAGGGTAGWLSALFISKIHSHCSVTVIENSAIGVIGTGEGSTGLLRDVIKNRIWNFGCSEKDFLHQTHSIPKLGIEFRDWGGKTYISPIDGSVSATSSPDKLHLYAVANDIPNHYISYQGVRIHHDNLPFINLDDFNSNGNIAYHFDGQKVGKYFKGLCDVDIIDDEIVDLEQDDNGNVVTLITKNQKIENIDLIIDCLGFNSIFSKRIDKGWVSYKKHLPVNTALPFQIPNIDIENTKPTTLSHAKNAGWMWQIPVGERYGCGYVFSSDYISIDEAYHEIEKQYGKVDIIKTIKFESGRVKELWKNNIISIGLSSGFLEPLQATAIHTVICHLNLLCFDFITSYDINNQGIKDLYNKKAEKYFDDFVDFINLHYQVTEQYNEFWKYMQTEAKTDFVKTVLEISRSRSMCFNDFEKYPGAAGSSLWNPTIAGLNLISPEVAKSQLNFLQSKQHDEMHIMHKVAVEGILKLKGFSMKEFMLNQKKYL